MFVSLHMDSAPNPLARGATIYSLSDVASDAEAARFAAARMRQMEASSSEPDGSVRGMLSDLALREQMNASAGLAERLVRKSAGRFELRPEPHRFAAFPRASPRRSRRPCCSKPATSATPTMSSCFVQPEQRAEIVLALAQAIEADVAVPHRPLTSRLSACRQKPLDAASHEVSTGSMPRNSSCPTSSTSTGGFTSASIPGARDLGAPAGILVLAGFVRSCSRDVALFRERPAFVREAAGLSAAAADQRSRL